jgi:hypothetical protein
MRHQQLDLDAFGLDQPHRSTIWIPVEVRMMQLLPRSRALLHLEPQEEVILTGAANKTEIHAAGELVPLVSFRARS